MNGNRTHQSPGFDCTVQAHYLLCALLFRAINAYPEELCCGPRDEMWQDGEDAHSDQAEEQDDN